MPSGHTPTPPVNCNKLNSACTLGTARVCDRYPNCVADTWWWCVGWLYLLALPYIAALAKEVACFCCQKSLFLACIPSWKCCARDTTLASKSGCSFWIFVWRCSVSAWQLVSASSTAVWSFPWAAFPFTGCQSFREKSVSGGGVGGGWLSRRRGSPL